MSREDDVKKLIVSHNRRLQKLKEQQASLGLHTPPHILTDAEDIETEIEKLQIELEEIENAVKPIQETSIAETGDIPDKANRANMVDRINQKAGDNAIQVGKVSGNLTIYNTVPTILFVAIIIITVVIVSGYDLKTLFDTQQATTVASKNPVIVVPTPLIITSTTGKKLEIYFWVEQNIINPGDCTTIKWDIENADKIYLEGGEIVREGVSGHDSRQVCPITTSTYILNVEANGENYSVKKTVALKTELPSGKIALTSDRGGQGYRIFVINLFDDKTVQITNGANRDSLPVDDWDPFWTPDGKRIVFESGREGEFDIFTISLATSELHRLTTDSTRNLAPVWSPDSDLIAFQSVRATNFDIYLMKADGSNVRRLTNHDGPDMWPGWSPNGQRVVFESKRSENGKSGLYIMSASGSDLRSLLGDDWNNGQPTWSKNGKIAFYSDRDGNKEIYTINEDGTNLKRITFEKSEDWFPAWSPDGKWIAFTSSRDGNLEIYITDLEGQHLLRVTNDEAQDRDPAWGGN